MTISADSLKKIAASGTSTAGEEKMTVILPGAEIAIDGTALAAIASQTNGSSVTMTVDPLDSKTQLTAQQQAAVGDHTVYDISITSGTDKISTFNNGSLTVSLPYTLKSGENAAGVVVWYINAAGAIESIPATYDAKTGRATFTTTHLSLYAVAYDANASALEKMKDVTANDWFYRGGQFCGDERHFSVVLQQPRFHRTPV